MNSKEWLDHLIKHGSSGEQCFDIIKDLKNLEKELEEHKNVYHLVDPYENDIGMSLFSDELEVLLKAKNYRFNKKESVIYDKDKNRIFDVYTFKEDIELCRKIWEKENGKQT